MNIALIVHDLHEHGGHSLYSRMLADELSRRHDVTVFANRCERPDEVDWNHVQVSAWRRNALSTVKTFPLGMQRHAARLADFDIRHTQGFCGGRPNVVTAHICLAGYLNSLRNASAKTRLSLSMMASAEKRFYRNYKGRLIAVSKTVANELREFYDFRGDISVIHHGVRANSFDRANRQADRANVRRELGINTDQTVALYVGDLTKAHTHLRSLAAALPDVQFVIVTRSTQYHWESTNVHILPATDEVAQYYAAADAFVFPTTYDAFGMVVLEAMAAGLPVFASDCAGAAEIITPGKDGFVTPLDEWIERTIEGLGKLGSLGQIGSAAAATARRHDWSSVAREVEQVYFAVAPRAWRYVKLPARRMDSTQQAGSLLYK